jgi:hypothetical protein
MANVRNANTFHINTVSSSTASSYLDEKDVQVIGIIFQSTTAGNEIIICDLKLGTAAAGDEKMHISTAANNETLFLRLADMPIRFPNGIWISSLDAGCSATLILRSKS